MFFYEYGGNIMKKIGLIVNPIAGMGGKVGLKGTDGEDVLEEARKRGAEPESLGKTEKALNKLKPAKNKIKFYVAEGDMGETVVKEAGFEYEVVHEVDGETRQEDTQKTLEAIREEKVDLILFSGGDGTARDVTKVIHTEIPVIGIPAGVKIHSPVYAVTPEDAGELALKFIQDALLNLREEEVIDIEEEAFRRDEIITKVYGYMTVPYDQSHLQNLKSPSPQSDEEAQTSAALTVIDEMEDGYYYILGSGSTTSRVAKELDLSVTMLGVDIIKDGELIAKDVYDKQILEIIGDEPTKLIVTPMGGQGYLFGRGNQQLSSEVLKKIDKNDIIIVSTPGKLQTLDGAPLLVYTGDREIDEKVSGYYQVIIGFGKYKMYKVEPS